MDKVLADIKPTLEAEDISGSRKIGKMRSLAIVLLSAVALSRANPCQNDQDVYFPDREGILTGLEF